MEQTYLLDSNIVIDYLAGNFSVNAMNFLDKIVDSTPKLSIITKIEVLGFNSSPEDYNLLLDFIHSSTLFDLTEAITDITIDIRKSNKIRIPDAIIAATALQNKFTLLTRNTSDFKNIKTLDLINPWDILD